MPPTPATGGTILSGVVPNRDNVTAPDIEQEKREQARQESEWARGERPDHPPFTREGPTRAEEAAFDDSNVSFQEAVTEGRVLDPNA